MEYVANVRHPLNASYGYNRLDVLLNKSSEMLDFFEFLGYLFTNGTLGLCLDDVPSCTIYINPNGSKFNTEVAEFLHDNDALREKIAYDQRFPRQPILWANFDEYDRLECEKRGANVQLKQQCVVLTDSLMNKLKPIFNGTVYFYHDFWGFNRLLRGQPPRDDEETYRFYYETHLRSKCQKFEASLVGKEEEGDVTIRSMVDMMGPTCDNPPQNSSLRSASEQLARTLALNGGASNRCFQNFIIRYRNYSAPAYESIVDVFARYLYRDTLLHGLCLSITRDGRQLNGTEQTRRKKWVVQNLKDIAGWLLDARVLLKESPPTARPEVTIVPWSQLKATVEDAIGDATLSYPSPDGAVDQYKGIYENVQHSLLNLSKPPSSQTTDGSGFQVLVYYPAYDSTDHCTCDADTCNLNSTQGVIKGSVKNVNYVVAQSLPHRNADVADNVLKLKPKIKSLFSDSDLCQSTKELYRKLGAKGFGFAEIRAVAAIRCAKKFVWYELAYHYFQAAYTQAPSVKIPQQGSTYNSSCGMVVLFA